MNNKENRLIGERKGKFCALLIFRSGWIWSRCGNHYLFSSHEIEWRNFFYKFFELLPKVFRLLYLGPTRPTQPIKAGIKPVQ